MSRNAVAKSEFEPFEWQNIGQVSKTRRVRNRNKFLYNDNSAGIDKILFKAPGNLAMPKFYHTGFKIK